MKEIDEMILEPDPARVMEGLRDTGYDFNTAMADLVDNSIAAYATVIKVGVQMDLQKNISVYIADNGCGMNLEGLKNAMRYGSNRRTDASSLGKFGLGLKTASTAFCRSLSVLSKDNSCSYHKVGWDLDEICRINKWKLIVAEVTEDDIELLEDVTSGGSGTLVKWEKIDRLMHSYKTEGYEIKVFKKIIDKLKFHLSMVYQRFLDSTKNCQKIELYVNDEKIEPWDPFCLEENNTQLIADVPFDVEMSTGDIASCILKAYLLPRVDQFSSAEAHSNAHVNNDMQGFYVYRENRLIHFGDWLGTFTNDPHYSLLRINFSFDHKLDNAFNVDIKKSRILLNEDIFQFIKTSFLTAPRKAAADLYRKGRNEAIKKTDINVHSGSNKNIEAKAPKVEDKNVNIDVIDQDTGKVKVKNSNGEYNTNIKIKIKATDGNTRVIPVDSIEDGLLWEPTLIHGSHAVSINRNHEFYAKVYAANMDNPILISGLDSLLWALAESELTSCNDDAKEQYDDMKHDVSRIVKKLVKDLPEPDVE